MFIEYSTLERKVFNKIRFHFEKMEPLGSQDYKNGFSDIIAQYIGGGESYMMIGNYYDKLVEELIADEIEKLSEDEKKEFKLFYENHFLMNYIEGDEYIYINEELAGEVFGRFKCWIDDNYSEDDLVENDDVEEDEEEDEEEPEPEFEMYNSQEKVVFLKEIFRELIAKVISRNEKRRLQLALIYLAYHPLAPDGDFVISVSFRSSDLYYLIEYSYDTIRLAQFATDDGSCWYDYKFELTSYNDYEEQGDFYCFTSVVHSIIAERKPGEIGIRNEYL